MSTIVKTSKEGQRIVYPGVNRSLSFIAQSTQLLYCEMNRLCGETPINLVGSMLMLKYRGDFINELVRAGVEPSKYIVNPFVGIGDVVLDKSGVIARNVFLKNACGRPQVGIVTQGDLAGLILYDFQIHRGQTYATASNLFNDMSVISSAYTFPYEPNFYTKKEEESEQVKRHKLLYDKLKLRFRNLYTDFVHRVQASKGRSDELRLRDLFFAACEEIGLSIDKENFHYTTKA